MAKTIVKRVPKSKDELKMQMKHMQKIERQKKVARLIFPLLSPLKTIYDAQTVVMALSGFIKAEIANKMVDLKVIDLDIDFSKEKKGELKDVVVKLHEILETENADDMVAILERFGNGLGQYSSKKFMESPMSVIKMEDFIA